jgi:ATP-dependent RNA circularization protein (DNA/RNA ligase family)
MKIEIVFQEANTEQGIKKNDIFTYEKLINNIRTFANGVQIVDDFEEDYTNEDWLENLINGLNDIGIKYEIIKIEL